MIEIRKVNIKEVNQKPQQAVENNIDTVSLITDISEAFEQIKIRYENAFGDIKIENGKFDYPFDTIFLNEEMVHTNYPLVESTEDFISRLNETTPIKSIEEFNALIKAMVECAGYGTREGVVAAAMMLAYIYPKMTGYTLNYSHWYESTDEYREGITEDIKMDCRSFAWWCIYNGGYEWCIDDDGHILSHSFEFLEYAQNHPEKGLIKEGYISGEPGDIVLKCDDDSHVFVIVGEYDGGYYTAEEGGESCGLIIRKRPYSELEERGYTIIDIEKFERRDY